MRAHVRVWGGFESRRLTCVTPGPATRDPPRHDEENRTSLEAAEMWAATAAAEGVTSEEAVASRAEVAMKLVASIGDGGC